MTRKRDSQKETLSVPVDGPTLADLVNAVTAIDGPGVVTLASSPPPERSALKEAKLDDLVAVARLLVNAWLALLTGESKLPIQEARWTCAKCGRVYSLSGAQLHNRILLSLGAYYDYTVHRLIDNESPASALPPGLELHYSERILEASKKAIQHEKSNPLIEVQLLTARYLNCLTGTYFTDQCKWMRAISGPVASFEAAIHQALRDMHRSEQLPDTCLRILFRRLLQSSLDYVASVYERQTSFANRKHSPGVFSSIRVEELALLAQRHKPLLQRYGEKHVEKVFEHQLALVAQSFGFYVASTRAGERTVDLVCIGGGTASVTALMEAKTTSRPYSLPTKDQRALLEYISDVKRTLQTLPPLRYALIISAEASKTLPLKLRKLETLAGVPVRFCPAQILADLREATPGPLSLDILTECVLSGPYILGSAFAKEVAGKQLAAQEAHSHFVRALFSAQLPAIGQPIAWPDAKCEE